jgi:hypothetical protein
MRKPHSDAAPHLAVWLAGFAAIVIAALMAGAGVG